MDKTQEEIKRGHLARQIVENPLWLEFFETAAARIAEDWERSQSPEYREDLWKFKQVLRQVEKYMITALQTGQMAEMALAEMQEEQNVGS